MIDEATWTERQEEFDEQAQRVIRLADLLGSMPLSQAEDLMAEYQCGDLDRRDIESRLLRGLNSDEEMTMTFAIDELEEARERLAELEALA